MSLIPVHTTNITFPEKAYQSETVANNKIRRFAFAKRKLEVDIFESQIHGLYEIKLTKNLLFSKSIYLKKKGYKPDIPSRSYCLSMQDQINDVSNIDEDTSFKWYQLPMLESTPDEIVSYWSGMFKFKSEDKENDISGLRTPQLGALHSISAYYQVGNFEDPITVVLPTGTGKTETMLSSLIYNQIPKLLVLVPSNALRNQLSEKFSSLGILPEFGIVPLDLSLPKVTAIKKGVQKKVDAYNIVHKSNIIIATPNILNVSDNEALQVLCENCTDLFIDEAHHATAKTWNNIRELFGGKRIVQFTATPFRNDGEDFGGKIVFNYPLGKAQENNFFKHINLHSIEEYYEEKHDEVIANKAISILRNDIENENLSHLLMARVEVQDRASQVLEIYKKIAPDEYNPQIVHSGLNKSAINEAIRKIKSGESKIIISVKMLGEGFDLPNLKIAAIHDYHKSLPITLQFIGRFTRTSHTENIGDAKAVVNIADPKVEKGLEDLYSRGADWDSLLRRKSEDRIKREVKLKEVIENLKEKGNLHDQISLWNLSPSFSTLLFKTSSKSWFPERFDKAMPKCEEYWHSISESEKFLIVLAIHKSPVQWGNYKDLYDNLYKVFMVHWDEEKNAIFVYSNDYDWYNPDKLLSKIFPDEAFLIRGAEMFKVFNGIQLPLVRNLGASQIGAISFTQYFGPNVKDGLTQIEESQSELSNLTAMGFEDGERVIWGCSQKKGKVWSVTGGNISQWKEWAQSAWDKIHKGDSENENITENFLRPENIQELYSEYPVTVQWGEYTLNASEEQIKVFFGSSEFYLFEVGIDIYDKNDEAILIKIYSESKESIYKLEISSSFTKGYNYSHVSGDQIFIQRGRGDMVHLEEYLEKDPWYIRYADGAFSYNCYLVKVPDTIGDYNSDNIQSVNWEGVDITKESMGKYGMQGTVQYKVFQDILNEYDFIFNDDGPNEAADLVGLKVNEDEIVLGLFHCKYSRSEDPGARVDDLYDVCGQAQRCIRWKHAKFEHLVTHLQRRNASWEKEGYSRILKGYMKDLIYAKKLSRTTKIHLHVSIYQPGLRKNEVTNDILKLLGATEYYINKTTKAGLDVYCS